MVFSVAAEPRNQDTSQNPGFEELKSFFKPGASLVLEGDAQKARVPLYLSSEIVPEDANGNPDPANATQVYRGFGGGGSAIVAVKPDAVTISVNRPEGFAARMIVTPEGTQYVAPQEEIRGPLHADERRMVVPRNGTDQGTPEDVLHVAPPGGHSIQFTKHIRANQIASDRKDPVNVVFYDNAYSGNVGAVVTGGGWSQATGICTGTTKYLYLYDAQHGGSDAWHQQLRHYSKNDACTGDSRYHMRLFSKSSGAWEDTHSPGFEYYSLGPVHYEDGFAHSNVYPQVGQDRLYADISGSSLVGNIRWTTVSNSASDCDSCDEWNGLVDFYQVYPLSGTTPDPCNSTPSSTLYFPNDWMVIRWTC